MSELKRDYWSDTLDCISGKVKIDRREIAAVVISKPKNRINRDKSKYPKGDAYGEEYHNLDIHLKSGTIFTITNWDVNTIANLYLTQSPHEEVKVVPNTFTIREGYFGKAPESEE